jgi:hypothetical protein
MLSRLKAAATGGSPECFRGSTITYRLVVDEIDDHNNVVRSDAESDSETLLVEVKPFITDDSNENRWAAACLLIGVGGFVWHRHRRRREEEQNQRQAIDQFFRNSLNEDRLWA